MIRVVLPYHLRMLAQVGVEVQLAVAGPVTQRSVLDALEARYPMLRGTIRDHVTGQRRPMLRFFACAGGSVPRAGGRSAARRGCVGGGAVFRCRGHCGRLEQFSQSHSG